MPNVGVADRLFLTVESAEMPQHVACLGTFTLPDGASDDFVTRLVEDMRHQATFAEPFNLRLRHASLKAVAQGWVVVPDDAIDLDFQFRHSALPRPGSDRELASLVSRLHSTVLDPDRPLWECHVIEGLEGNRFAFYFKVHHALLDGMGGVQRLQQMLTADPADLGVRPLWTIGPSPKGADSGARSLPDYVWSEVRTMTKSVNALGALAKAAGRMVVEAAWSPDPALAVPFAVPTTVLNGRIGRQRRVATQLYEFARIKKVAAAANTTINDVFLAICAGGLRRYLDETGDLPAQPLIAGTPVSVRLSGDDATTNAFSMVVMKLFTDIVDPRERLAAINRSSTIAKQRLSRLPKKAADLYAVLFMGPFVTENLIGLGGRVPPPYNVIISNIPGPLEQQYLAGAQLEALYPLACLYHGSRSSSPWSPRRGASVSGSAPTATRSQICSAWRSTPARPSSNWKRHWRFRGSHPSSASISASLVVIVSAA